MVNVFLQGWTVTEYPQPLRILCPEHSGYYKEDTNVFANKPTSTAPTPTPASSSPPTTELQQDLERARSPFLTAADIGSTPKVFRIASKERFSGTDPVTHQPFDKPVLVGHLEGEEETSKFVLNKTSVNKLGELGLRDYPELFGHGLRLGTTSTSKGPSIIIIEGVQ